MRSDQRPANQLRDTALIPDYTIHAEGSVLISAVNMQIQSARALSLTECAKSVHPQG